MPTPIRITNEKAEVSDRRDMEHFHNRTWTGIAHKQANPSSWNNHYQGLLRKGKHCTASGDD
ncbi:hypothetical protein E4U13_000368 [Claviceps humidiphila]|uniref:Uncharacterized protein n=1 Tax=Claviceps humidiphila TaxID=1294629 RepID=A0A9P7Q766_9HYPO|nr:hypothetical protein E4U13_000368 [Claviceps humidiphila]